MAFYENMKFNKLNQLRSQDEENYVVKTVYILITTRFWKIKCEITKFFRHSFSLKWMVII